MKRTVTEIVLDILQYGAGTTAGIIYVMSASRPESYRRAKALMSSSVMPEKNERWSEMYAQKKKVQKMLSQLKNDGLVSSKINGRIAEWSITSKGKQRLKKINARITHLPWLKNKKKSLSPTIVSYDIPEELGVQRSWLREILSLLEYKMIHKSVWAGNVLLPNELIKELIARGILKHVHIFEVTKQGTLEKVS